MNPADLAKQCVDSINGYTVGGMPMEAAHITLVTPKGWKRPPKFPRGELLMVHPETENRVWSFKAVNILAWLTANGFVKLMG